MIYRMTRVTATVAALATVASLAGCSGSKASPVTTLAPSTTASTVLGAAGTLRNAALAMESASSYRFAGAVNAGGRTVTLAGEFSAPDRLHEVITVTGAAPVERIVIGSAAYQRNGATWQAAAGSATASDPRSTFAALAQATTVSQAGTVYRFTLAGAAANELVSGVATAGPVTGTVTLTNNQIADLSYRSAAASGTTVHFTYSDIGTTPAVVAPKLA
jgi:hypothetical protein